MFDDISKEIRKMQIEMNKNFEKMFNRERILSNLHDIKDTNIKEDNNNIFINIKLPNIDKKDIQLLVRENAIEIKASKKSEIKIQKKGFYKHEQSYGGFYKVIPLPSNLKTDEAKSKYKNNILKIKIPKKKVAIKEKKIIVK
jgi:HSP20 family protein